MKPGETPAFMIAVSMRRLFLLSLFILAIQLSSSASGNKEELFIGVSIYRSDDAFTEEERQWIEKESLGQYLGSMDEEAVTEFLLSVIYDSFDTAEDAVKLG